jgi:proteasome lid subunit RPN8/RPN11
LYPEECCGALVGESDRVDHAVRLANTSENDRRRSYRIDPDELLSLTRQVQSHGTRILAIYHSHPDSEPRFSDQDAANACPWYRFLIVSVRGGRVGAARCYQAGAEPGRFTQVEFKIERAS